MVAALGLPGVGDVIADKYRLDHVVGQGAMGRVYRGHHLLLDQPVAIKFLLHESLEGAEIHARFLREAKATMALKGEHVVRVFDLGVLPATNTPYMVMEFLEGKDLRAILGDEGQLPVVDVADYILQVCEGLAEAHMHGIVHRDLKPQNLFLTKRANGTSCVKLLDFGISKLGGGGAGGSGADELTHSNVLIGSPVFVPPEQIRDARKVDGRADIWSLGVVVYMLLGGGRPFSGDGLAGLCASIMVDEPQSLRQRVPHVPDELEALVFRCLEKKRERRFANVAELATALAPFGSALGRASLERVLHMYTAEGGPPAPARAGPTSSMTTTTSGVALETSGSETATAREGATSPPTPAVAGRRRRPLLVAGLGALLLVGGVATFRGLSPRAMPVSRASASVPPTPMPVTPASSASPSALAPASATSTSEAASVPPPEMATPVTSTTKPTRAVSSPRGRAAATEGRAKTKTASGQLDRNGLPIID